MSTLARLLAWPVAVLLGIVFWTWVGLATGLALLRRALKRPRRAGRLKP